MDSFLRNSREVFFGTPCTSDITTYMYFNTAGKIYNRNWFWYSRGGKFRIKGSIDRLLEVWHLLYPVYGGARREKKIPLHLQDQCQYHCYKTLKLVIEDRKHFFSLIVKWLANQGCVHPQTWKKVASTKSNQGVVQVTCHSILLPQDWSPLEHSSSVFLMDCLDSGKTRRKKVGCN